MYNCNLYILTILGKIHPPVITSVSIIKGFNPLDLELTQKDEVMSKFQLSSQNCLGVAAFE